MDSRRFNSSELAALLAGLLTIIGAGLASRLFRDDFQIGHLRCAIELSSVDDTTKGLLTGYNYHLLERFAEDNGATLDICISRRGDSYIDSLKMGSIDMVVAPYGDAESIDSVEMSIPVDSISVWLVQKGDRKMKSEIDKWVYQYHHSASYQPTRDLFLKTYDPFRLARSGRKLPYISPYDSIVRRYADTLGWDWKLLSAVIYQESRFKIDARSHRGAIGLMQMMPYTAGRWSDGDIVNPEQSIRAGTFYLKSLQKRYNTVTGDPAERLKYTLAAYNAGEGRIRDVINYARLRGVGTEYWDSLVTVIPEMRDSALMAQTDTVKLGVFKGHETLAYVERVFSLYRAFNTLYRKPADERK